MAVDALPRTRLAVAPTLREQRIVSVEFRSAGGRSWKAIGGGDTLAAALEWAWQSCPPGASWRLVGWEDLHGD